MRKYNRALDLMAIAAVKVTEGKGELAAKLLIKATRDPSFESAIAIVEASNAQAYSAVEKQKAQVSARRKVQAAEDEALEGLTGDIDDLDMEEKAEDEVEADADGCEPEGEPGEVEDEAIEIEDDEIPMEAKASNAKLMAAALKRMTATTKAPVAAKKAAPAKAAVKKAAPARK